jgi:hypothetical protein
MKKTFIILAACFMGGMFGADAQTWVNGYTREDGTYVQGHYRSERNHTNHDNYSTSGNINPFTGSSGSVARDYSSEASSYGSGRTIYTGPRGGQYYYNDNGNKTYVPKQSTSSTSSLSSSLYGSLWD